MKGKIQGKLMSSQKVLFPRSKYQSVEVWSFFVQLHAISSVLLVHLLFC
uniref:Uncharacterized protein n=1 Tax=Rhizophora mucronata TaxID=61149 RepID=A0A2P2M626_RHIMU